MFEFQFSSILRCVLADIVPASGFSGIFVKLYTIFSSSSSSCQNLVSLGCCSSSADSYIGRVKLAGNMPFSLVPSLMPISQPSSCKKKYQTLNSVFCQRSSRKIYLILGVLVLDHVDDVPDVEAQLVDVLPDVLVGGLHPVQDAGRQISGRGAWKKIDWKIFMRLVKNSNSFV